MTRGTEMPRRRRASGAPRFITWPWRLRPAQEGLTLGGDVAPAGRARGGPGAYTLTRLHARYGPDDLTDDPVFRPARSVNGGRGTPDRRGRMPTEVQDSGINTFQGRYAILHRWRGPIACEHPIRGRWGGPPDGRAPPPTPATDLAIQPRRRGSPSRFLRRIPPELPVRGRRPTGGGRAPAVPGRERALRSPPRRSAPARTAHVEPSGEGGSMRPGAFGTGWPLLFLARGGRLAWRRRRG
ncbi:MAG: hypothetical protein ACFCGT_09470 [Sandaracinaceae bacterium]